MKKILISGIIAAACLLFSSCSGEDILPSASPDRNTQTVMPEETVRPENTQTATQYYTPPSNSMSTGTFGATHSAAQSASEVASSPGNSEIAES